MSGGVANECFQVLEVERLDWQIGGQREKAHRSSLVRWSNFPVFGLLAGCGLGASCAAAAEVKNLHTKAIT